jgi:hypothetical protein
VATPQWLHGLLVLSCASLFFQLFPSLWWAIVGALDPRLWSWKAYAALFATAIVVLVAVRAWQERSRDSD